MRTLNPIPDCRAATSKTVRVVFVALLFITAVLAIAHAVYVRYQPEARARKFHALGLAITLYEVEHQNVMPDRLNDLVTANMVSAQALGPDDKGIERYLYFASGKNANGLKPSEVIAADPYGEKKGGSVLLSDGSTLYVSENGLKYAITNHRLSPEDRFQPTMDSTRP